MSNENSPSSDALGVEILKALGISEDLYITEADIRIKSGRDIEVDLKVFVPHASGVDYNQAGTEVKRFTIIAKED